MEYHKFPLNYYILQTSDLDITFQDYYVLCVILMTGKKLHLNTLMTADHESLNLMIKCCRWNADSLVAQRPGFLSISDTKNVETISQIVMKMERPD